MTLTAPMSEAWFRALLAHQSRALPNDVQAAVNRGRALVRGDKVVALHLTPGLVSADVDDGELYAPSVRVTPFSPKVWDRITHELAQDLATVTGLFEGVLPASFVGRLAANGVQLVPTPDEISGDCTCHAHVFPCAHLAAAQQLVGRVIDADPLELLTLRGRGRDALLAGLRAAWGGEGGAAGSRPSTIAWGDDPYASPGSLDGLRFDFRHDATHADDGACAGLRALGPMPGDVDIQKALAPMYEAGSALARAIALGDTSFAPAVNVPALVAAAPPPSRYRRKASIDVILGAAPPSKPLMERIVEALSDGEGAKIADLVARTGATPDELKRELVELEELGLVVKTGATRGTRWHLG